MAERVDVLPRACAIAATPDTTAASLLARPASEPCPAAPPAHSGGTIWLDFADTSFITDPNSPLRILVDNNRLRGIDLVVLRADGSREVQRYDAESPNRSWAAGGHMSLSIFPGEAPVTRILMRLDGIENLSLVNSIHVVNWREGVLIDRRNAALFGIAVGMVGITIIFHLALFFAIRKRFQLFHCINVAVLFGYSFFSSGLVMFAAPVSATMLARLVDAMMIGACASGVAFLVEFLERGTVPRIAHRIGIGTAVACAAMALAMLLTPPGLVTPVLLAANVLGAFAILLICALLAIALSRGSRAARVMAVGWTIPLGVAILFPLRLSGLAGDFQIPDGALLYALTLECIVLSLPVVDRIKRLRIEHERARERQSMLERQALTDALTGLANRHGFDESAARLFGGAPDQAALLIIDIDHFKAVNDAHGHGHGDMILKQVADHVAKSAGAGAIVARFGGEEFVVALRGHDEKRATTIAERIRFGMASLDGGVGAVTVSIGVACGLSTDVDTLIDEADRALYAAKRRGRDCVVVGAPKRAAAA